jgi:hypothetical protein
MLLALVTTEEPRALDRVPGGSPELNDLWGDINLAGARRAGLEELRARVGN